jgi:hypothetical protein
LLPHGLSFLLLGLGSASSLVERLDSCPLIFINVAGFSECLNTSALPAGSAALHHGHWAVSTSTVFWHSEKNVAISAAVRWLYFGELFLSSGGGLLFRLFGTFTAVPSQSALIYVDGSLLSADFVAFDDGDGSVSVAYAGIGLFVTTFLFIAATAVLR